MPFGMYRHRFHPPPFVQAAETVVTLRLQVCSGVCPYSLYHRRFRPHPFAQAAESWRHRDSSCALRFVEAHQRMLVILRLRASLCSTLSYVLSFVPGSIPTPTTVSTGLRRSGPAERNHGDPGL